MSQHPDAFCRRSSVPTLHYTPQLPSTPGYNTGLQMLQGYPQVVDNSYQQHPPQPINHGPLAPRSLTPLTIPVTPSGPPDFLSISDSWYPPTHPHQQLGSGFHSVARPHQPRGAQQPLQPWDTRMSAGSLGDLSPTASGSQIVFESSDSATSPGADSDPYRSFPNTPGYNNGTMNGEFGVGQEDQRKVKQMYKKREEREQLSAQFERLKNVLGLPKATQAGVLERAIDLLGGKVPVRKNEPTQSLQGRESRSSRAKQVSASRNDTSRLFDEIARCLGYGSGSPTNQQPPRREILLKQAAEKLERRMKSGM
ncbi:hypothetical protein BJ322DRAFT_1041595 [Thelephora terrestris]|uniref:Uncharacterized protein n=1 Tax=Thelephora terrestris TaxID=56493 RepID=A0A9P6L9C5_9AGAM|nr:hypothetical protein BJ322DRAFT_1041595 [Thelephora terrestris]